MLTTRRIGSVSFPARDSIKVLETLLAEVEERRHPDSLLGKRKSEGDATEGGLKRAVKKLILDAEQSPGGHGSTPNTMVSDSPSQSGGPAPLRIHEQKPMQGPPGSDQFNFNPSNIPPGVDPSTYSSHPSMYPYQSMNFNGTANPNSTEVFPFTAPPSLDPTVSSMLTNYFPNADAVSAGMQGQPPEDFLQRLLSFSWDGGSGQPGPLGQPGQPLQPGLGEFATSEGWGSNGWMG